MKRLQIFFQEAMEKEVYQVIKILLKIYIASQKISRGKLDLVKMMVWKIKAILKTKPTTQADRFKS